MNKFKYIIVLALLLGGYVPSAQAQVKFDIPRLANKVTETVSGWQEEAQKAFEQSTTMQTLLSYGKGAMETAKKIKEGVEEAQAAANSIKDTATSTMADIQSEVNGLQGDVTGAAGGAIGGVSGGLSDAASKTQNAQKLVQLETQISSLQAEYNAAAEVRKNELEGKIKVYEENNAAYQEMIAEDPSQRETLEAKISANNEAIKSLQEDFDKKEAEEKAISDSQISAVQAQISTLKDEVAQESLSLAKDGLSSVKSLFGGGTEAELNETIANNFIPEKEDVTSASIKRVRSYRNKVAAEDALSVYAFALKVKATRDADNEKADQRADDVPSMDGSSGAIAMDTQLKVENMRALVLYVKTLIAEMKLRTAQDLASLTTYKLRDPSKDVTRFNLDDYKYKKPSKSSVNNLKNLASKAASAVKEVKNSDLVNDAKSGSSEVLGLLK